MSTINIHQDVHLPLNVHFMKVLLGDAELTTIIDTNFFVHTIKWNPVVHEHSYHELFFLAEGMCSFQIQGASFDFKKNDIIWIPHSVKHYVSKVENDTRLYSIGMSFSQKPGLNGTSNIFQNLTNLSLRFSSFFVLNDAAELLDIIHKIRLELFQKRFGFMEQVNTYFGLLYVGFLRRILDIPISNQTDLNLCEIDMEPPILKPENRKQYDEQLISDWLFCNYMKHCTLDSISRSLHLSVNQTSRLIKRLYGMGFIQKLTQVRMSVAQDLLINTKLPVKQIAESVGYNSYKGFFSAFKKHTRQSPTGFRQRVQKTERD